MSDDDRFVKDPNAVLDYVWDWASWLDGDTITGRTIIPDEAGITIASSTYTDTAVTVWLTGGTVGEAYLITCRITTAAGRTDDRTIRVLIREK